MSFRIAIVGSDAIGSYYGAKLAYRGSNVHFLMRGDFSAIRSAGRPLDIEPIWGEPVRRATAVGANVPRLEIVYALLKSLGEAERREKSAAKIASHSS